VWGRLYVPAIDRKIDQRKSDIKRYQSFKDLWVGKKEGGGVDPSLREMVIQ
jgi:hypothetical protein